MFHAHSGLFFERQDDGAVRIVKRSDANDAAEVVVDIVVDADTWCSVIACMSYYGEEDYGWYRARNFHDGTPLDSTTPLIDKNPNHGPGGEENKV